jgi:hypothetical protein
MYKCNSHTWEIEFTNFNWTVKSLFIDRLNNQSLIEIVFGSNSRNLETDLSIDTAQKALDYAKSILADDVISEQGISTINVNEIPQSEKYKAWEQFGKELIYEFNAMSSGMTTGVSDMILTHLQPVLNALNGAAIGVVRLRLNDTVVTPFFPQHVKDLFLNKIDNYLAQWN